MVQLTATVLSLLLAISAATASLQLPQTQGYAGCPRDVAISEVASKITNGPRAIPIGGADYPLYYGPIGAMNQQIQMSEVMALIKFRSPTPAIVAGVAVNNSASLTSLAAIADLYTKTSSVIERPMSSDNSDATFGQQRTTIKSYALREARLTDLNGTPLSLNDFQLAKICGLGTMRLTMRLIHQLYVESFPTVAQYNDPQAPNKYVPNVVGFFCQHLFTQQLLPIEIRLLDTKVTVTPFDKQDDWTLAKMALEAASVSWHQLQHMAETHAVTIPLRVEMLRAMAVEHPVRALFMRHVFGDFALEKQVAVLLLNTSTALDATFGWGATGSTRFLYAQTQAGLSMKTKAFETELRERGLHYLKKHKHNTYASMLLAAIDQFVGDYVDAFYASNADVVTDIELQRWAEGASTIPHVRDFPATFQSKSQLRALLTHIIYSCSVKHHAYNGAATWHGMAAPYSPAALWKPLPTRKGQQLNLLEYTTPVKVLPVALQLGALFFRSVPQSESLYSAYTVEPFASEPKLAKAIANFKTALDAIEQTITQREADEKWPYMMLAPSRLPHYTWV